MGHTGKGDYGHGMDVVFDRPDVEVLAVADLNEAGRAKAQKKIGAARAYADLWAEVRERVGLPGA